LRGNVLAKVTDFGMARLGDINPQATRFTSTTCPGTDVYMPPEAVQDKPVYTEKIDCFSYGVIIVQILTRQFPEPGDRLERMELNHPGIRTRSVLVEIPEVDRRQNHISQVNPNHSLLPIALDCLKDKDSERPSAHQLCERVADLNGKSDYRDSARAIQDKDEVIRQLRQQIQEKIQIIGQQSEEKETDWTIESATSTITARK
jgi:serine/threonine protein kinase